MQLPETVADHSFAAMRRRGCRMAPIASLLLACALPWPGAGQENPSNSGGQGSLAVLRQLASEQIAKDGEFLGRTRFRADLQNQTYFYDLKPAPTRLILAEGDPYATPLEALIRIEALRRDFRASVANENFWTGPLAAAEDAAAACVQSADALPPGGVAAELEKACSARLSEQFKRVEESIAAFAEAHKLRLIMAEGRDAATGFPVQIKVDPPRARVRVMPLLEYKKYQFFKTPPDQYRWNDLLDTESQLIGWYHYRAEWPAELNGPDEGDFCIKNPGTITFRPTQR